MFLSRQSLWIGRESALHTALDSREGGNDGGVRDYPRGFTRQNDAPTLGVLAPRPLDIGYAKSLGGCFLGTYMRCDTDCHANTSIVVLQRATRLHSSHDQIVGIRVGGIVCGVAVGWGVESREIIVACDSVTSNTRSVLS